MSAMTGAPKGSSYRSGAQFVDHIRDYGSGRADAWLEDLDPARCEPLLIYWQLGVLSELICCTHQAS